MKVFVLHTKNLWTNKMENKIYHTVGTVPKSNRKIVERGKIDTSNVEIHDISLSWSGTGTLIKKNTGIKLVHGLSMWYLIWRYMYLQGETEEKLFVIVAFLFFPSTLYKTKLTSHDFVHKLFIYQTLFYGILSLWGPCWQPECLRVRGMGV